MFFFIIPFSLSLWVLFSSSLISLTSDKLHSALSSVEALRKYLSDGGSPNAVGHSGGSLLIEVQGNSLGRK